jgi:hypothetical protein
MTDKRRLALAKTHFRPQVRLLNAISGEDHMLDVNNDAVYITDSLVSYLS